jgi:diacylglycerol kinase family enzyme
VRRLLLVTNPAAQRIEPRARRDARSILGRSFDVEEVETKGPGHATEIAGRAPGEGYEVVCVLGGDGTANEAAGGLVGSSLPLAVLPGGGANVLVRSLGLPNDIRAAAGRLAADPEAPPRRIPLGRVGDRVFICNCGFGFDAEIVRRVESRPDRKRRFGDWYFVWKGIGVFAAGYDRRSPHLRLSWDDGAHRDGVYLAIVQNLSPFTFLGRRPIRLCPQVRLDGGLDCIALDTMRSATVLPVLFSAFGRARHTANPHVTYLRHQHRLRIEADRPMPLQMDGEFVGERTQVTIESLPAALSILG